MLSTCDANTAVCCRRFVERHKKNEKPGVHIVAPIQNSKFCKGRMVKIGGELKNKNGLIHHVRPHDQCFFLSFSAAGSTCNLYPVDFSFACTIPTRAVVLCVYVLSSSHLCRQFSCWCLHGNSTDATHTRIGREGPVPTANRAYITKTNSIESACMYHRLHIYVPPTPKAVLSRRMCASKCVFVFGTDL